MGVAICYPLALCNGKPTHWFGAVVWWGGESPPPCSWLRKTWYLNQVCGLMGWFQNTSCSKQSKPQPRIRALVYESVFHGVISSTACLINIDSIAIRDGVLSAFPITSKDVTFRYPFSSAVMPNIYVNHSDKTPGWFGLGISYRWGRILLPLQLRG